MPGVDRSALSKAFTRALSSDPEDRFASCVAFCDALNGAIVPELPLLADVDDFSAEDELQAPVPVVPAPNVDDVKIVAEESMMTAAQPDLDTIDAGRRQPEDEVAPVAVPAWNPSAAAIPPSRTMESPRFGPIALFLAVIVGAIFGFAAGYMARPRALQSGQPQEIAVAPGTDAPVTGTAKAPDAAAPKAPEAPAPKATPAPEGVGRILVRSTPSGASVTVDGIARGVTPLALRDLDVGTRNVAIARRGYISETVRVVITKARPSRTLDVRLTSAPAAKVPVPPKRASSSASAAKGRYGATAATGGLSVDSRPTGATVTINGTVRGTTPLAIDDLAPGEYRIQMAMPGYRNFATTVRVVAGERVRAAASLTALEQQ
jgi:hypothetical protein